MNDQAKKGNVATIKPAEAKAAVATESKRDKFVRLGSARMAKAIAAIRNVGNLANANSYEFTADDIAKIGKVLGDEVIAVDTRFRSTGGAKAKPGFTF